MSYTSKKTQNDYQFWLSSIVLPILKSNKRVPSYPNGSEICCVVHSINFGRVQTQVIVSAEIPLKFKLIYRITHTSL